MKGYFYLEIPKHSPCLPQHGYSLSMVCLRLTYTILSSAVVCLAQWRFIHFHGQQTTRQDRYKSIYKDRCRKHTILFRFVLSPLFFFFPHAHLRELEKLWTDEIIVEALWRDFMQKLVSEWTDFVLYVSLHSRSLLKEIPPVLTPVNPTVDSDARRKCRVSSNPRCHSPPSVP
jgi:hypothetical protein